MNNKKIDTGKSGNTGTKGDLKSTSSSRPTPLNNNVGDELGKHRTAYAEIQQIRRSAQRELQMARQRRTEAERYAQETEMKARSQAQMLILQTRLATKKEITELQRKTEEEIQKLLVDIRMVRIMAQEELETQRKYTDASRINALSVTSEKMFYTKPEKLPKAVVM